MADWLPERLPEDIDAERSFLATCCAPGAGFVASEAVFALAEEDFVHPCLVAGLAGDEIDGQPRARARYRGRGRGGAGYDHFRRASPMIA